MGLIAGVTGIVAGCTGDKPDPRFAADTYDQYTEPLTNAVVGTPEGTTEIGPAGETTFIPAAISAAKPAAGTGGSVGTGGAVATGGSSGPGGHGAPGGSSGFGGMIGTGGVGTGGFFADGGVATGGVGAGGTFGTGGFGMGGIFGSGGTTGNPNAGFGFWHLDDCSPTSHFLADSSGFGANAQQALSADCVAGISGQGVLIRSAKDIIQVPDEPQFTVSDRVAVAAWVHPSTVSGTQPIIIKRLNNQTSFSLGIHNGNIEMSVVLSTGKTVISSAPISAGVWTHVAGMYDGTFVFLFINGQQFGQVFGGSTLKNVFAPLRFGATTQSQFLNGIIDEVFVSTQNITKDQLAALSCITRPSTFTVNPASSPPTAPDTSTHFDVVVTDNDIGACQPKEYDAFIGSFEPGINPQFTTSTFQFVSPGQTFTFGVDVSGSEDADPGAHQVTTIIDSFSQNGGFEQLNAQFTFNLQAPTGCFVSKRKELMITSTGVVDDQTRTTGDGAWSFGHMIRQLAPSADQAPAFALALFQHWLTDQTVNGFKVAARPGVQQQILDIWPKTATGDLDLDQAPFQLNAIVNRFDIRDPAHGNAGEGRMVYALKPPFSFFGEEFTVIFEFNLPATTPEDVTAWANRWHALASHQFPSPDYNQALEAVTRLFTDKDPTSTGVNNSNIAQVRTNDFVLANFTRWELREFQLSPTTGFLDEVTVKETPDLGFNNTQTFSDFVNQNEQAVIAVIPGAASSTVPAQFEGSNFLAGSVFNDLIQWNGPGIKNPEARFHASMNTCNGCHGPETNTGFLMISPRGQGQESQLSAFITGTTVFDPFSGQVRTLNDLGRRQTDLTSVVCAPAPMVVAAP